MLTAELILVALVAAFTTSVSAGEIVLYAKSDCNENDYPYVFSADVTTDCRQAPQGLLEPLFYGATTSRNINNSCKFNLYTDTLCKTSAGSLTSSGPLNKCLTIAKGLKSYQITCGKPVGTSLVRPHTQPVDLNTYFQPQEPYRGKPSGNNLTTLGIVVCDHQGTRKPTGTPRSISLKLASAFFSKVPAGSHQYTTSATDGGTLYTITITGNKGNGFTADAVARHMGITAFASLMADTVAAVQQSPCEAGYEYDIAHYGNYFIGGFNMSYVAP